jgi:2-polyprenyl-3-methyl-5-hydroxy-6-metoxy-1,4-benzoquinol methylase/glycosyltransferase involved in cell wall biosynthesis
MRENNCPVCDSTDESSPLCELNGYKIFTCQKCAADYVYPMPQSAWLKSFYDREEWFEGGLPGGYSNYDQETAWSVDATEPILQSFDSAQGLSVLDIGCGYGSHLAAAAQRGWKCFGVEVSDHARKTAQERLGGAAYIVESVADLIPHEFDLILILDVIEHLSSPKELLFSLFSLGAIAPKTRIVISTPNAGSVEATRAPEQWRYRHPPSHLVYYRAQTLRLLLAKLHFTSIDIQGVHPLDATNDSSLENFGGLLAIASGSDFTEFMRERYVPGTWSKIAEYEHMPRYELAKRMAVGKTVFDFGCGTGYGSAMLAAVADTVTGLDIDASAIAWATESHHSQRLRYICSADLGAALPSGSFDLVTCFEMIEHVDFATQCAVIASLARLLKPDGTLIISTPNPEVTKLYGANPYHLREMTLEEFDALLRPHFPHIQFIEQRVRTSIAFDQRDSNTRELSLTQPPPSACVAPLAFIAVCSRSAICDFKHFLMFDDEVDVIHDFLTHANKANATNLRAYQLTEQHQASQAMLNNCQRMIADQAEALALKDSALLFQGSEIHRIEGTVNEKDTALQLQASEIHRIERVVNEKDAALQTQASEIHRIESVVQEKDVALQTQAHEITKVNQAIQLQSGTIQNLSKTVDWQGDTIQRLDRTAAQQRDEISSLTGTVNSLQQTVGHQLERAIARRPVTLRGIFHISALLAKLLLPSVVIRFLLRIRPAAQAPTPPVNITHKVNQPTAAIPNRPKVVHALANFCTGGSSRLVADLMEHLGHYYEQSVLTSHIPNPPAYSNLVINELAMSEQDDRFIAYLMESMPSFIHIHYWGDCDMPWYAKVFSAAEALGIPVVENINTPVDPYYSSIVSRYVYVSHYVQQQFGKREPNHLTIYPGSDFSMFVADSKTTRPNNCVGMVYRLETDKLNEAAIQPFIRAVKKRPGTKALIVGGGSLLARFQSAVAQAGLEREFEFTDYVRYSELPDLYRRMSVFVAPVWKESFGQVTPFAMNMGVPVCGYDVGAIGEILDNPSLLAPAGDADRLADVIVRLLDSPEERAKVGEHLQARAQAHYSLQAMIGAYKTIYQQMTEVPHP